MKEEKSRAQLENAKIVAKLNPEQRAAVERIYGPVMVLAGPGTGKTELLARRIANILSKTDTVPENILCLTYTEAGATNMIERLAKIIGRDAYRVPIFTFHGFGSHIIQKYREYFFSGADFLPIDEITGYEILQEIFEELPLSNPLTKKQNDKWIFLHDTKKIFSDIKKSGLSPDQIDKLLDSAENFLQKITDSFCEVFSEKISKKTLQRAEILLEKAEYLSKNEPKFSFSEEPNMAEFFVRNLKSVLEKCYENNSTKYLTKWKDNWAEKKSATEFVFKDLKKITNLRAANQIYRKYSAKMIERKFYDYDDMILNVIEAIRANSELKFDLQEKFQFVLVDEFQDTNDAQMQFLNLLTDYDSSPNIMVVGDDDQAIYRFQGAEVSNLRRFMKKFSNPCEIILQTNYRSDQKILQEAEKVAQQIDDRLNSNDKKIKPNSSEKGTVRRVFATTLEHENQFVAQEIAKLIQAGENPSEISVIARQHSHLADLLPFLEQKKISVNYSGNDNILQSEPIELICQICETILLIQSGNQGAADEFLPKILAHEAFDFASEDIWRISLQSYAERKNWLEIMLNFNKKSQEIANWLICLAQRARIDNFEKILDEIIGKTARNRENTESKNNEKLQKNNFVSPIYNFYFSAEKLQNSPENYFVFLNNLLAIRDNLREFNPDKKLQLEDFVDFLNKMKEFGQKISAPPRLVQENRVNFLTAHSAKGLEFNHVFIIRAESQVWGEKTRTKSQKISWPKNLAFGIAPDENDEKLRLFFVAMTRARHNLIISGANYNEKGKKNLELEFIQDISPEILPAGDIVEATEQLETAWNSKNNFAEKKSEESAPEKLSDKLRAILAPQLKNYTLSATHLNNFLDVSKGGPQYFLKKNILHFPESKSPYAAYGTAVHGALQRAHQFFTKNNQAKETDKFMADFCEILRREQLDAHDELQFLQKGAEKLPIFYEKIRETFNEKQHAEFSTGIVLAGEARLSGKLDVLEIDKERKILKITDYKTGKAAKSWYKGGEYEKIKLRKYRQQLLFYYILMKNSPEFRGFQPEIGFLQFVEPDDDDEICALEINYSEFNAEISRFEKLLQAVWKKIITLDFPDICQFSQNAKGMADFEEFLIENTD